MLILPLLSTLHTIGYVTYLTVLNLVFTTMAMTGHLTLLLPTVGTTLDKAIDMTLILSYHRLDSVSRGEG